MTHALWPQLVFLLNLDDPAALELSAEPLAVELQCALPGITETSAREAILAEVGDTEGMGVEAVLVCAGPDEVIVHLTRDLQNASTSIDLSAFPASTRARALALTVAEAIPLLVPEQEEEETAPTPVSEQPSPTLPDDEAHAPETTIEDVEPPRTLPTVQIHLWPVFRAYFNGDQQGGGKVSIAIDGFEFGVHALAGKKDGGARGSHMGGQVGYDFFYLPYQRARPVLGVETNIGYSDSGDLSSGYGAGLGFLGWNAPLGKEWRATLRGECGYSFRGAAAAGSRFAGGFVGASVIPGAAPEHREAFVYR